MNLSHFTSDSNINNIVPMHYEITSFYGINLCDNIKDSHPIQAYQD